MGKQLKGEGEEDEGKRCCRYGAGNDRTPFDEPKSGGCTGGRSYLYHG